MNKSSSTQPNITLEQLKKTAGISSADASSGNDYLLVKLSSDSITRHLPSPLRIDCMTFLFFESGNAEIKVDFTSFKIAEGSVLAFGPGNLIEISAAAAGGINGYALFLSKRFINEMSIDNNALDFSNMTPDSPPNITLSRKQQEIMRRQFELMMLTFTDNPCADVYSINIMRSFVAALVYQMMSISAENKKADDREQPHKVSRKSYYIRDFMRLVADNFRCQRSVNFYADRLFISPKYLSLIVKEATGYTATEWIDRYLVLEAKNLLRFSGRNIQQIAYDLNFHNQSSFGKYFKHQTGMSPSQFRRT